MENLTNDQIIKDFSSDPDFTKNYLDYQKSKDVKEFKKIFKGGYLGYKQSYHLGNISNYYNPENKDDYFFDNLTINLKTFLNKIPENLIYSILPVIRWQYASGEYKALTVTKSSIKITRDTALNKLTLRIVANLKETLLIYDLRGLDIEFYIMSRPWLKADDFNIEIKGLTQVFDEQIERELSALNNSSVKDSYKDYATDKVNKLRDYEYKNISMFNYGKLILDKDNKWLGYKLKDREFVSVITYFNKDNLLCCNVSVKDIAEINKPVKYSNLISWLDTKTDSGFIREFNRRKYYYDKNNNLINVEVMFNYSSFPIEKKDVKLDHKIGTIDFETYGSNLGLGFHQVYAGGWAVEGETKIFYINKIESSDQLVNIIFFK